MVSGDSLPGGGRRPAVIRSSHDLRRSPLLMARARAQRLTKRARSLLGRQSEPPAAPLVPPTLLELACSGPVPLAPRRLAREGPLSIAVVIPSFRRGSGGHATIVRLARELRGHGHAVSLWLEDCEARHVREPRVVTEQSFEQFFAADGLRLHTNLHAWPGADVVLATGWQTVARVLLLPDVGARAYLVQDHEPDFYGASAEALWAAQTYRQGLHCIAASPWLAQLLRTRYGSHATHFDLGVDHALYRPKSLPQGLGPRPSKRAGDDAPHSEQDGNEGASRARTDTGNYEHTHDQDIVAFYARAVTPRRAVPLGLAALSELSRRRPHVEIALYGEDRPLAIPFAHSNVGVLDDHRLADLYARASVGMVLSLTNPSLIGLEMMACGLPCVELASASMIATFGEDGPLTLTEADPLALCTAIERLLDDSERRRDASRAGLELTAKRTWESAGVQVGEGLRAALEG
jgi:glycosyltransferase involved in cell wall biosynthesis